MPFAAIRALAEAELGVPLERAFAFVDPDAAGRGIPRSGAPGDAVGRRRRRHRAARRRRQDPAARASTQIVDVDLRALRRVAGWLSRVRLVSDRVDMPALVEEFAHTSLEEIDYLHEAANAERFAGRTSRATRASPCPRSCGSARRGAC